MACASQDVGVEGQRVFRAGWATVRLSPLEQEGSP